MATDANSSILQSDIDALFALANSKTTLLGVPYSLVEGSQWGNGSTYAAGDLVIFNGNPFISKVNGNTFPPTCVALWQGVTDRGTWNSTTIYNPLDTVVFIDGNDVPRKFITLGGCPVVNIPPLDENGAGSDFWQQMWLSAYNRLRANLNNLNGLGQFGGTSPNLLNVSGPWPIGSAPNVAWGDQWIYYEDNGVQQTVSLQSPISYGGTGGAFSAVVYTGGDGKKKMILTPSTYKFIIGGTIPALVQVDLLFKAKIFGPTTGAAALMSLSVTTGNFTPTIFTFVATGGGESYVYGCVRINETLSPGVYGLRMDITQDASTQLVIRGSTNTTGYSSEPYNSVTTVSPYQHSGTAPVISASIGTSSAAVGIDGTKNILKMGVLADSFQHSFGWWEVRENVSNQTIYGSDVTDLQISNMVNRYIIGDYPYDYPFDPNAPPGTINLGGFTVGVEYVWIPDPATGPLYGHIGIPDGTLWGDLGLINGTQTLTWTTGTVSMTFIAQSTNVTLVGRGRPWNLIVSDYGNWNGYPWTSQPTFYPEYHISRGWNLVSSVSGLWMGKTPPVQSLGFPHPDSMPWNLLYLDTLLSPNHYGWPYAIPPMNCNQPYTTQLTISGTPPNQTIYAGGYYRAYGNWETELNPPAWKANTWYPTGFKIRDKNGNIQTMVTPTGGLTGAYYPGLPPDDSLFSTENGVVMTEATGGYELNGVKHSQAQWKCTVVNENTTDTWRTSHAYPVGAKITDRNWNTQTVVSGWFPNHAYAEGAQVTDGAGISQLAITGSVSGATAPTWHGALGATTSDGSVVWQSTGSAPLTAPGMREPAWPTPNLGLAVLKPDWSPGMLCRTQDSVTIGGALYQCTQGGFSKTLELVSLALINGLSFADGNVIWKRISDTSTAPAWVVNMDYSSGTVIVDSNGNEQSCVQIGVAGTTPPTWATTLNALTNDGTAQWKCTRLGTDNITCDNGVNWRLTALPGLPVTPAVTRQYCIPKYPVVRYGGNYPFPEGFNPVGWWIYEVTLNRLGKDNGSGVMEPQSGSVPVTLGCMRNGSFVSFGTWNTGQTIPAMWPIFTAGPLVYQCSETVDVQAVVITCGLNFQTGGEVTYPICAAYYNDMMALLGLIS